MPIGDLLAEISGEKPSPPAPSPAHIKTSVSAGVKRKADGDSGVSMTSKIAKARHADGSYPTSLTASTIARKSPPPINRSGAVAKSSTANSTVSTLHSRGRPYMGTATSGHSHKDRPSPHPSHPVKRDAAPSRPAPVKPSPMPHSISESSNKAPKKGSFAEIMARATKAQQTMPRPGVIQHKPIERPLHNMKERAGHRNDHRTQSKGDAARKLGVKGHADRERSTMSHRDGLKNGTSKDSKVVGKHRPGSSGSDHTAPEKKFKKAAAATTGYTGTARPPPSSSKKASSSRNGNASRAGGLLAPPKASRSRYMEEEYDLELDDFIDDDEDDGGFQGRRPVYDYESDGSSDMEAGLTDIDLEEEKSGRIGRKEDRYEEEQLERHRREKEERRRRMGLA